MGGGTGVQSQQLGVLFPQRLEELFPQPQEGRPAEPQSLFLQLCLKKNEFSPLNNSLFSILNHQAVRNP